VDVDHTTLLQKGVEQHCKPDQALQQSEENRCQRRGERVNESVFPPVLL
jgi:hypothetical protein